MSEKKIHVNLFGCLPFVLGLALLSSLGFCGATCQKQVQDGVRTTINAFKGQ